MNETCFACGVDTNGQETVYTAMVDGRPRRLCSKDCAWVYGIDHPIVGSHHICANCQFRSSGRCRKIMVELGHSDYSGIARPNFSCSLWEEKLDEPFGYLHLYPKVFIITFASNGETDESGLVLHNKEVVDKAIDWLNSLWNERKVSDESS